MKKIYVGSVYKDIQGEYVNYRKKPSERQFSEAMVSCICKPNERVQFESLEEAKAWFAAQRAKLKPAYIMRGYSTKYYMGTVIELDEYEMDEDGDLEYYGSIDGDESVYVEENNEDEDEDEEDDD